MLNRCTKLSMQEKVVLLTKFFSVDVNPFSSTESGMVLKTLQASISKGKKAIWNQAYFAIQLLTIYSSYKAHKATPRKNTREHRPGGVIFGFFFQLESDPDQLIGEFESEKEVEVTREKSRVEKEVKRYSNLKV